MTVVAAKHVRLARLLRAALLCTLGAVSLAHAQDAASLKAHYANLREQLTHNQFHRPLYLESKEASGDLSGDIYALLEQPYAEVGPALQGIDHWCDILILHLNVKSCSTSTAKGDDRLSLNIGRKSDQPLDEAYPVEFRYERVTASPDYLQLMLKAAEGPLGTNHYRIALEVVALDAQRSFLHLSYSYAYGMAANVAMQGYLATIGRNKVGFSVVDRADDGQPVYIAGMRGVVERNTMRYFLAIEAYLGALATAPQERLEKRLNDWFTGIERYPRQLHELERGEYLAMKHKEILRQRALESTEQPN
ncbi:hypothetical protein FBY03_12063 [Pseudomonas sp. SJZ079]|uniref:hypothetical protein n=1 Tax=Pseudomonas sp. SJZ079 TaxID=2572887 RepID=UPI001198ECEF|nr:hypothetical protein [Pseudomonas sp. SJZ079]TWC31385.1 hypothetical protein FBY03_12063 [Pseudomonas sp. SJZ079]